MHGLVLKLCRLFDASFSGIEKGVSTLVRGGSTISKLMTDNIYETFP